MLVLAMLLTGAARSEAVMDQLRNMRKNAGDRIPEMERVPEVTPTPIPAEAPGLDYEPILRGMKGEEVAALQERLIELGYLDGKADGDYGGKTAGAVRAFQARAGLEATGDADDQTQKRLYAADAHAAGERAFDYKRASGDAEGYRGSRVTFSGTVLQVLESDVYADTAGIYTALRVATRGTSEDVVYVAWFRAADAPAPSLGGSVRVYGLAEGIYTYQSEAGVGISLPRITAERVE